jgi:hypothetical protein
MMASAHMAATFAAGLLTALHGAATVSDTTSVSARPSNAGACLDATGGAAAQTPVDLDNRPAIQLGLTMPEVNVSLGYAPIFSVRSAFDDRQRTSLVLHSGYLTAGYGTHRFQVSLGVSGTLGTQSFTRLITAPVNPAAPVDPTRSQIDFLPPVQAVDVLTTTVGGGVGYQWSHRWNSTLSAAYSVAGGRGEEAQALLPQSKVISAGVSTGFAATPIDQLTSNLTGTNTRTSNNNEYTGLQLGVSWGHRLSPTAASQLTLGTSAYRAVNGLGCSDAGAAMAPTMAIVCTRETTVYPTAAGALSMGLLRERDFNVGLGLGASVVPAVTALTGRLQQRVQGTATVSATILEDSTVALSFDSAQTVPRDEHEVRVIGVGITVGHRLSKLVDVTAGYRTAWQQSNDPALGELPQQWSAFLGLSLRAPPLAF